MKTVEFLYLTGCRGFDPGSVILSGSWDAAGIHSEIHTEVAMARGTHSDGCPVFTAQVKIADSEVGKTFHWGVVHESGGRRTWGVAEEENRRESKRNIREFILSADADQRQAYRFNWSRQLGAQKIHSTGGGAAAGIQFAVWAPYARMVEVVMGNLFEAGTAASAIDPTRTPALHPIPVDKMSGGYIDANSGSVPSWGPFAMEKDESDVWRTRLDDPALADFRRFNHCPYMFRITRDDGSVAYRTDLYSRCQIGFGKVKPIEGSGYSGRTLDLDGTVSCSVVKDPDEVTRNFSEEVYPEQAWMDADGFWNEGGTPPARPAKVSDLVIYELHVGALGFGRGADEPGTLEDAIALLDYLKELGVNAVELLPLSEFGGGGENWGYSTSHYFAIEYAGGGRDKFKHFIRECHRRGMAVIMDVVFNHYSHDAERAEWQYDSKAHERNIYYWYEGLPGDYPDFNRAVRPERVGHGGYVDNLSTGWAPRYWEPMVRRMFVSSLIAQALEFKIDGFRFDQTTSIHAYNVLHANGNKVESANLFGQKLLREAVRALRIVKPGIMIMAEDHSNSPAITTPLEQGGFGFDSTWYSDFYHHLIGDTDKGADYAKLLKTVGFGNEGPLAIDYFAGALASSGQGRVVYHESHDEAGNGKYTERTIHVAVNGAPLVGDTRKVAEARTRTVAAITLLSAGTPMFLFGEEVGAKKRFLYGEVLQNREDLHGLRAGDGAKLFAFYQALIGFRLSDANRSVRSRNIEIVHVNNSERILAFRRWGDSPDLLVVSSLNNRAFNAPSYALRSEKLGPGNWREVFNSDSARFGGRDVGNGGAVISAGQGELRCVLPANGVVVFQKES